MSIPIKMDDFDGYLINNYLFIVLKLEDVLKKITLIFATLLLLLSCSQSDVAEDLDNTLESDSFINDSDQIFDENSKDDFPEVPDDEQREEPDNESHEVDDEYYDFSDDPSILDDDVIDDQKTEFELYADCVFEKVNEFRSLSGVGTSYERDKKLDEVGEYYSGYMADNNTFAHSADGMNFGERLDSFGVAWVSAGENLQKNSFFSWLSACNETVNGSGGWSNSTQGHREAMLGKDRNGNDKGWTHAGVGVSKKGSSWYVAMYFVKF